MSAQLQEGQVGSVPQHNAEGCTLMLTLVLTPVLTLLLTLLLTLVLTLGHAVTSSTYCG